MMDSTNCLSVFDHFLGLALKELGIEPVNQILRNKEKAR